jgi:cytidine deaminase
MEETNHLIRAATDARANAHVPYSGFAVGAAVLTKSGKVFKGCNVENVSLRLTLCAEEVAVGGAIAAGEKELIAIAVVADSKQPILPCGACRQLLAEFNPAMNVISTTVGGTSETHSLDELLPKPRQGILEKSDER